MLCLQAEAAAWSACTSGEQSGDTVQSAWAFCIVLKRHQKHKYLEVRHRGAEVYAIGEKMEILRNSCAL